MTGHWICDACGCDGEHADWCKYLRPPDEQWMGHRTREEMQAIRRRAVLRTPQESRDE